MEESLWSFPNPAFSSFVDILAAYLDKEFFFQNDYKTRHSLQTKINVEQNLYTFAYPAKDLQSRKRLSCTLKVSRLLVTYAAGLFAPI